MSREWEKHYFEYSHDERTSEVVADAIATVRDGDPTDLPPLYKAIPTTAFETLLKRGNDIIVTFSYEELEITVSGCGRIVIREPV